MQSFAQHQQLQRCIVHSTRHSALTGTILGFCSACNTIPSIHPCCSPAPPGAPCPTLLHPTPTPMPPLSHTTLTPPPPPPNPPDEVQELDLSLTIKSLDKLLDFLSCSFNGGTDVDRPLALSLERLAADEWKQVGGAGGQGGVGGRGVWGWWSGCRMWG